jgi:hypothetical protein
MAVQSEVKQGVLKIDRYSDRLSRRISGAGSIFSVENHAAAITASSKGSSGKTVGVSLEWH